MAYLPAHLAAMAEWLDLAAEVVVVDSVSHDGTLDFIKQNLHHPGLRLLSHPPGLYESWNYGLQNLTTEHAYISTVGDTITRGGLRHLLEVAETQGSDVVMSRPRFVHLNGRQAAPPFWPVNDMIQSLRLSAAQRVSKWEFLVFAMAHSGEGLLGSSASNLYRAKALANHPFPVNFGKAGDGAWALQNCCRLQWSVTPEIYSTFLLHPDLTEKREKDRWAVAPRLDQVLQETIESELKAGRLDAATMADLNIAALQNEMSKWRDCKLQFDRARQGPVPWIIRPAAWRARVQRNRHASNLARLKAAALEKIQLRGLASPSPTAGTQT